MRIISMSGLCIQFKRKGQTCNNSKLTVPCIWYVVLERFRDLNNPRSMSTNTGTRWWYYLPCKNFKFFRIYKDYHSKNIYTSNKFTVIFIKNHKSNHVASASFFYCQIIILSSSSYVCAKHIGIRSILY